MSNQYQIGSLDVLGPLAPYFRGGLLNNSQIQPMGPARTTVTDIQKMYADKPFVPGSVTGIPAPTLSQDVLRQGVGGAYNLETGEMKPTGLLGMFSDISDSFSNMSADETTNLLQGLSGLLSQTAPAQQELQRISIPSATAGLRLPEVDLMQYYKGLL
jgi:hypothetical protein